MNTVKDFIKYLNTLSPDTEVMILKIENSNSFYNEIRTKFVPLDINKLDTSGQYLFIGERS